MKNNSNIYDIDGEIIRRFDDVHRFTALEATNIQKKYNEKLQDLYKKENRTEEDEKKIKIYETYCKNLQHYISVEIQNMSSDELNEYYKAVMPESSIKTTEEAINKAIEELKNDIETGENTENEVSEQPTGDNEDSTDEELGDDGIIRREPCDIHEERSISQSDLLVERDGVVNNMDEYVDYEEV